jgi:hypothetical protein
VRLARHPTVPGQPRAEEVAAASAGLGELGSVGALMRSHPANAAPGATAEAVAVLLRGRRYPFLS